MRALHVILLPIFLTSALYSSSSPVVKLTSANFQKEVINSEDIWLVEFYAPWCGHCQKLAPEWEKAAKALKGIVKVGALDMTTDQNVGAPYNIQGFPTIKFFGDNKKSPLDYNSGRTAKEITNFAIKQSEQIVNKRLTGKSQQSTSDSSEKDVVVLTDSNFEETVLKSKDMWLVEFYAPWCGHCKKLAPEWAKAASMLKGQIKVAKIDATSEQRMASKYNIQGYPTIKIFPPGDKTKPEDYSGPREAESIVQVALSKLEAYGVPPEIYQIVSKETLESNCQNEVCILVFLPHILDSSAAERNKYLDIIKEAAKKTRSKPIKYLWAQAGDFYQLEQMMNLGFGYPAVVAISLGKTRYAVMHSAFKQQELDHFTSKILSGTVPLTLYSELPKMKPVQEWDGKDSEVIDL